MKKLSVLLFMAFSVIAYSQDQRIVVAKDGSGDFTTVQEAINSVRAFYPGGRTEIFIKEGEYREKLVVYSWLTQISLVGESRKKTVLVWDDHAGKAAEMGTFNSYTLLVQGNDFIARNLTIKNDAPINSGQAVALHAEGDRGAFYHCDIIGTQDTYYAGGGQQYFKECYIEGTTDYIFGPAVVVFKDCEIHSKRNSYITAANTPEGFDFGFVFLNCRLTFSEEVEKMYLGRPWRDHAKTVFINTYMGDKIRPEGWHNWKRPEAEQTSYYAEYNSSGPGAHPESRVPWSYQLTEAEAAAYTLDNIFSKTIFWNPENQLSE